MALIQLLQARLLTQVTELDGRRLPEGMGVLSQRLGQRALHASLTPRGELLIVAPDAHRYFLNSRGELCYQACPCPEDGGTGGSTNALDYDPADYAVGADYA